MSSLNRGTYVDILGNPMKVNYEESRRHYPSTSFHMVKESQRGYQIQRARFTAPAEVRNRISHWESRKPVFFFTMEIDGEVVVSFTRYPKTLEKLEALLASSRAKAGKDGRSAQEKEVEEIKEKLRATEAKLDTLLEIIAKREK